jgi:hypothetical protein
MKKKVTPVNDRSNSIGRSLFLTSAYLPNFLLLIEATPVNNDPATTNLKVAVAIGVNPSFNAILITTNELPKKRSGLALEAC